jgi:tetratricopeptide (TPR) repeat protein
MSEAVIAWEKITIPTYELDVPEKSPIFYEMRNHQGTRGNLYPHYMIDKYLNKKTDHIYNAIRLENDFIRVVTLPELGGRIWEGYDKRNDYNFVYKNNVIKPAMIGLAGAWISGGIEFNWPTHHRPTTYMPVDATIEENEDGSKTAWMGEIEALYGLKGMVGVTIWPDRAYFTVKTRVYNPTSKAHSFHWWANLAVHANDDYQVTFPPDIDYITGHYKTDVAHFPVVEGYFGRAKYEKPTDITWFKNIHAGSSFFIFNSNYNFMGGYDHAKKKGTVHIADRHISPGKKFFDWGLGESGVTWQKNLTDSDGPYIEIMTGCYTDNQPDFTWILPDETKTFEQSWFCTDRLPNIKNANKNGAVSLAVNGKEIALAFNSTMIQKGAKVVLSSGNVVIFEKTLDIEPGKPFIETVKNDKLYSLENLYACLCDKSGVSLVEYSYKPPYFSDKEPPKAHKPAREPCDIPTNEELYFEGLQIEQYHHPLLDASKWYKEALKRDPGDYRCNVAMGLRAIKRGEPCEAEQYLRSAVKRQTMRNQNPGDGDAYYYLGLALLLQGQKDKAVDVFRKSAWNLGWKGAALKEAAKIYVSKGEYADALKCCAEALRVNYDSLELRLVYSAALRKTGDAAAAEALAKETVSFDPLDLGARFEFAFAKGKKAPADEVKALTRGKYSSVLELAGQYFDCGLWVEAKEAIALCTDNVLKYLYLAYAYGQEGDAEKAQDAFKKSDEASMDYCFPSKDREIAILSWACEQYKTGSRAPYLLGLIYYGRFNVDPAIKAWETAVRRDDGCYTAHRCLAISYFDKLGDKTAALKEMEKAFAQHKDPRYLLELVQIYKALKKDPAQRLALLESNSSLLHIRDDLYNEYVAELNVNGKYGEAVKKLADHIFHPYEGGEGILSKQHLLANWVLGREAYRAGNYKEALDRFTFALEYPENYGEGRRPNASEAHVYYYLSLTCEKLGNSAEAKKWLQKSADYEIEAYDEGVFFRGLALRKLGRNSEARIVYQRMLDYAGKVLADPGYVLYFPGFPAGLPFDQSLARINTVKAWYARFLGYLGLGDSEEAYAAQEELAKLSNNTPWVKIILSEMEG